jgi:hypothetical protein
MGPTIYLAAFCTFITFAHLSSLLSFKFIEINAEWLIELNKTNLRYIFIAKVVNGFCSPYYSRYG